MVTLNEIKDLIFALSASVSMISVAVGVFIAIFQYRLKLKEEERLALSTRANVDINLFKSFTELMDLAMGRRQHVLSEKAVEKLFELNLISKDDFDENFNNSQKGSKKLSEYGVVILPVGKSGQEAAIAAIATLAKNYSVLKAAAIQGLESIKSHNEVAKKYLAEAIISRSQINKWSIGETSFEKVQTCLAEVYDSPTLYRSYNKGEIIPSNALISSVFSSDDGVHWNRLPVKPVCINGNFGLFESTDEFTAPGSGSYWRIVPQ